MGFWDIKMNKEEISNKEKLMEMNLANLVIIIIGCYMMFSISKGNFGIFISLLTILMGFGKLVEEWVKKWAKNLIWDIC